ncbi:MAG: biotin-dependent carboxyltransferase family protein [Candidatus Bipolaricaulis sp.]|nr:biotin-dependent carboxyltransferase family protein [Candidatus Bipolaricaulis sp.]
MSIEVLDPGLLTTLQDLGRAGYERYGVPPAGAADPYALRLGNLLLGNEEGEAGLEVTLLGPTLRFEEDCWIAITGADLGARWNGAEAPLWETLSFRAGDRLSFGTPRRGVRAYVTVAGGVDVAPVLSSRSTYLRAKLGGLDGRALKSGDRVRVRAMPSRHRRLPAEFVPTYDSAPFHVVLGPQDERFTSEGLHTLLSSAYEVRPDSDRMGIRLEGPRIRHAGAADIISEPVCTGAIQVPAGGEPIVLLVDRQTIGGYAKIGTVISADLPRLGQVMPGDRLTFAACSLSEAHERLREREAAVSELRKAIAAGGLDCRRMLQVTTPTHDYTVEITIEAARRISARVHGTAYDVAVEAQNVWAPPDPDEEG